MKLTITNETNLFKNSSIFFYVIGQDNKTSRFIRLTPNGDLAQCELSDKGTDGFVDYSIPLQPSGDTSINLPPMQGGRIYFSINKEAIDNKLKFKLASVGTDGIGIVQPAPWTPGDPNERVLFDWVEFALNDNGINANTTMVDMFSIPMRLRLIGRNSQWAGALAPGARKAIFSAFHTTTAPLSDFNELVVDDLRVVAPGHGIDNANNNLTAGPTFQPDYLDDYIKKCWKLYQTTALEIDLGEGGAFTGQVDKNMNMIFTRKGRSRQVKSIPLPTTSDVFFCAGVLRPDNDIAGAIVARVAAALNRTTLLDNSRQPDCDASHFYRTQKSNFYSKVRHDNSMGGAYGFAFDDVCGFQPTVADPAPAELNVTLDAF